MIQLYGAGGHAKVIIEIAEALSIQIHCLIDNVQSNNKIFEYTIVSDVENSIEIPLLIAIGNNTVRKKIANTIDNKFCTLIHPKTTISNRSTINEGTVVMAGVTINSCSNIGKHCIINTNASIDHDCKIEDYVHISPNAALAGNVTVGEGTHVGIGANIIQNIKIGKWVQIGAGAVIINDIPDYAVVVGNPGKIIKFKSS